MLMKNFTDSTLTSNTVYTYSVSTYCSNFVNTSSQSNGQISSTLMSGPPTQLFRKSSISPDFDISFEWDVPDFNSNSRCIVYRNGVALLDKNSAVATQSFSDINPFPAMIYNYTVACFNIIAPTLTALSPSFAFYSGPSAPTQPTAVTVTTSSITFQWSAPSNIQPNTILIGYNLLKNGMYLDNVDVQFFSYTDVDLSANTVYEYAVQAIVTDVTNATYYGQLNRGLIRSAPIDQTPAIIGASVGGVVAILLIISAIVYLTLRKVRKMNEHVEDIKVEGALHFSEERMYSQPTPITVTPKVSINSFSEL